jgi:hypothetical protein
MQIHKDCFYTEIIKRCFPDANNLHKPKITGWVSPAVFIINTNNQIRVCKFNNKAIVLHNKYICDLLISHDIQIPKTTVHNIGDTWFESYEFIPEWTLQELIDNGLSQEHIFTAYKSALNIQHKISQIKIPKSTIPCCPRYIDIIKHYAKMSFTTRFFYSLSTIGKQFLMHNDIYPRNILYSPEKQQAYLIDIDSISFSNFYINSLKLFHNYPLDNYEDLATEIQKINGRKINVSLINKINKTITDANILKCKIYNLVIRQK